jgi:hypothetical protein
MPIPKPSEEPIAYAGALLAASNWVAAFLQKHYGFTIDPVALNGVLTPVIGAFVYWVRKRVHPDVKVQEKVAAARAEGIAIGSGQVPS